MNKIIQICCLFLLFYASNCAEKLCYVQIIWRHGDRAPLEKAYPEDLNDENNWSRGWGQLTIEGMKQMEELGQFLRERYVNANFLAGQFDKKATIIRSTDVDRALESAQSLLSGMFPPQSDRERFDTALNWEPIAIHANRDVKNDPLLNPSGYPCARYKHLREVAVAQNDANLLEKYKALVAFVRPHLNIPEGKLVKMIQLMKLRHITPEIIHNLPQPKWVLKKWDEYGNKTTLELIMEIRQKSWVPNFNGNEEIMRLNAGFLLNEMLGRLNKASSGNGKLDANKMALYSSHDSTLLGLLSVLNVKVPKNALDLPPYAGCVIIDLYEERQTRGAKNFFVQLFYRRNQSLEPLIINGCDEKCELNKFLQILEPKAIRGGEDELKMLCQGKASNSAARPMKNP
uniref:Acid phosphatase n=1 Tax=Globodera rostochiensis TaxID=31243 RepID=A0A914IET3_GLORO